MEFLNTILDNTNIKYIIIIAIILYISTVNPPINSMVNSFYNNILGKILLLLLIIYYSDGKKELGMQIAMLLTLLYIILLNINNTQDNITSYGKLINNNLIGGTVEEENNLFGGTVEEENNLLSSEEESLVDNINEEIPMEEEPSEEQDIDKKINTIIQEEIVLNKSEYNNKLKTARKLGATQYKLNTKLLNAQKKLNNQTEKYKNSEDEYNKIMRDVEKYDTNKDGIIDYNDIEPEEDLIQEEMENVEEEMEKHMNNLKKIGGEFDKLVSHKKIKGGKKYKGGEYNIDGYENQEFSTI